MKILTPTIEHERLLDLLQETCDDELDYSVLDRHIEALDRMAKMSNSGVTIYDIHLRKHVFVSYNFPELFDCDKERIKREDSEYFDSLLHPDDLNELLLARLKYFRKALDAGPDMARYKLISEYRLNLSGNYVRVIEQQQALETDSRGNVWLALSLLDISPNQTPFTRVESRIFDIKTRQIIAMPSYPEYKTFENNKPNLTVREKEVLKLVREGFLSKEISAQLSISLNTVNTYRQRIIEKLDVNNSQEAIRYAEKFGLLN